MDGKGGGGGGRGSGDGERWRGKISRHPARSGEGPQRIEPRRIAARRRPRSGPDRGGTAAPRDRRPGRDYGERPGGGGARRSGRKASGIWKRGLPMSDHAAKTAPSSGAEGPPGRSIRKVLERQRGSRSRRSAVAETGPGKEPRPGSTGRRPGRGGLRAGGLAPRGPDAGGTGIGPEDTAPGAARARRPRRDYSERPGGARRRGRKASGTWKPGLPMSDHAAKTAPSSGAEGPPGRSIRKRPRTAARFPLPALRRGRDRAGKRNLVPVRPVGVRVAAVSGPAASHPGALTPEEPGSGRKTLPPARRGPGGPGGITASDPEARGAAAGRPPGHGNWGCRCPTRRRRRRLLPGRRARRAARSGRH